MLLQRGADINARDDIGRTPLLVAILNFAELDNIGLKVVFGNRADVQRLEESPLAQDQAVREREGGRFELTVTIADTLQLRWWLRGYGDRVEVVEPVELRREFIDSMHSIANLYGGKS